MSCDIEHGGEHDHGEAEGEGHEPGITGEQFIKEQGDGSGGEPQGCYTSGTKNAVDFTFFIRYCIYVYLEAQPLGEKITMNLHVHPLALVLIAILIYAGLMTRPVPDRAVKRDVPTTAEKSKEATLPSTIRPVNVPPARAASR